MITIARFVVEVPKQHAIILAKGAYHIFHIGLEPTPLGRVIDDRLARALKPTGIMNARHRERLFADGLTLRAPLPGTVPRGHQDYPWRAAVYGADEAKRLAGENLVNPLPPTLQNLRRGERVYDNFCQPCHGFKGMGDGSAVGLGRLAAPNSLHSAKAKRYSDGEIFHIITEGQNKMPSYAWQLTPLNRWAAVHYIRVLQRAQAPLPGDLPTTGTATTPWGLYLAVFLVVIPVIAVERAPGLDFVPAYFVGAGAFFALITYVPKPEAIGKIAWYVDLGTPIMVACVMGVIYGWITVTVRGAYEKKVAA